MPEETSIVPVLELRHITRTFPQVAALDDVSLQVAAGSIHAILGEDGAGKTTLLRILAGVHPVGTYTGEVLLDGKHIISRRPGDAIQHRIAVVLRRPTVFEHLSIAENIMMARWQVTHQLLINSRSTEHDAQALLDKWGVSLDAGEEARQLGNGVQRLIMMVRALSIDPRLVVLDEPLYGIGDAQAVSRILHLIRRMAEHGVTCLYLARRANEACQIADQVTVLRDGTIVGTWERMSFDEPAMAVAMQSQRPGDVKLIDEDDVPTTGGIIGSLQNMFRGWGRS